MSDKVLIYCLKDPFTKEIKYIGSTTTSLSARLSQHLYDAKTKTNKKTIWLNSLTEKPIIELLEEVNLENFFEKEKEWINKLGLEILVNTSEKRNGLILNRPLESVKKNAEAKYVFVYQYSLKGILIKKWNSIKEASQTLNISRTAIGNNLKRRSSSAGGFMWSYEKDDNFSYINKRKIIIGHYINNNLMTKYQSIKETANILGISVDTVYRILNGTSSYGGYDLRPMNK